jgi:hypothetical protein
MEKNRGIDRRFPCGLPSWIVNCKLKYLEPIPIPESLEDFFFFVYLRLDVADPKKQFPLYGLTPKQLQKLDVLYNSHRCKYERVYAKWNENRYLSARFIDLELKMSQLLPVVTFENTTFEKDPNVQIRSKTFDLLPLPKFMAKQFLFGKEPVKPPDLIDEYYCYYERNWNIERNVTFDENPTKWADLWNRCSARKSINDSVMHNFLSLKENFDVAHESWLKTLSQEENQKFSAFKMLRSEIVKELF